MYRRLTGMEMFDSDSLIPAATASLYALENSNIIKENFARVFSMMVSSFNDDEFVSRLRSLGPRGIITTSVKLSPKFETLCFVDKLWFDVKKTSSRYYEAYYAGIGLTFKRSKFNFLPYGKLWISNLAAGTVDMIQDKLRSPELEGNICERLSEHVYNSVYTAANILFEAGHKVDI